MTSLYEEDFGVIPFFVVPGTEDSEVVRYETVTQMNLRLINEKRIEMQMEEIQRLRMQLASADMRDWKGR